MIGKSAIHVAKKEKIETFLPYSEQPVGRKTKTFVVSGRDTHQESILHPRTQKTKRWGSVSAPDKVQKL